MYAVTTLPVCGNSVTSTRKSLKGGALVSSAPTKQVVHQQSKRCTNKASDALIKQAMHQQNKWCTNKASGALETSAPPLGIPFSHPLGVSQQKNPRKMLARFTINVYLYPAK